MVFFTLACYFVLRWRGWWNLSYSGSCTAHLVQYHFPGVRLETAPHPIFGARRGLRAHVLYKPSYSCLAPILSFSPIPSLSHVSVRYFTIQLTYARPSQNRLVIPQVHKPADQVPNYNSKCDTYCPVAAHPFPPCSTPFLMDDESHSLTLIVICLELEIQ